MLNLNVLYWVNIVVGVYVCVVEPQGLWDFSSPTRD